MSTNIKFAIIPILLLLCSSAENVSLVLGQQHNFTVNGLQYALAMVGIAKDSATFAVSGVVVSPGVDEMKVLDLNGRGRVGLTLDQIMQNSTVMLNISYNVTGKPCRPINETCSGFNDCCVGSCIVGTCSYPPIFNVSETVNASLDVPSSITPGSIVNLKITSDDGKPIADAVVNILTPSGATLTLTTNENGEGGYLASEEGDYNYISYGYTLSSNKTTLSRKPTPPPVQTPGQPQPCGDGVCNNGENCSTCPNDCGSCHVQQVPGATQIKTQEYSSLLWIALMFLTIIIILRVLLPIFVRE